MYIHGMLRLSIDPETFSADALFPAVRALHDCGVVVYPTETFYALGGDPRVRQAVERIYSIKRRPADRAMPLIASDLAQVAEHAGSMTPLAKQLALRWWPGPLTLIIPASPHLCEDVHRSTRKVAVRVPGDAIARALAREAGHPVTSTSANLSGEPPPSTADAVAGALGEEIDVLIDAGATPGGPPSTIVDVTGSTPVLVREGAIAWERVLEFLRLTERN
jgi:L-threonylcarbamoyladenylate synthase